MPARMFPKDGPKLNDSQYAEPTIYYSLAKQLSDDFVIIHSLPWLSSAASQIGKSKAPTGEIDFLVLHPSLGILAVEVKGGRRIGYDRTRFVYLNTGEKFDPVDQVRRGVHGLANWLGGADKIYSRIGYAIAFPQADFKNKKIPPALIDYSGNKPENICIDQKDIVHLGERIVEIMRFWKSALDNGNIPLADIERIIDLICPLENYTPSWSTRIFDDNRAWLILTPQQTECLRSIQRDTRQVIEGRSGTGKTIIAIARARELSEEQNKHVLILVYNTPLAEKLQKNFDLKKVRVKTFHSLCSEASKLMGRPQKSQDWYKKDGPKDLHDAIQAGKMPFYDALIMDEAQVLHESWLQDITDWFKDKPIIACCDETQIFPYEEEQLTLARRISEIIGAGKPYLMTVNVRSPKAVFDRLQELQPPPYQQVSFRPVESDTLQEIAVSDPITELYRILFLLHIEGVSPKDITVVHTEGEQLVEYPEEVQPLVGETISIYRFRGLESPIIIVLALTATSSNTLACAYARATSRCIVIYNIFDFLIDKRGCDFTRGLFMSQNLPSTIKEATQGIGKLRITTPLIPLNLSTVALSWSTKWAGWVISEVESHDSVAAGLWRAYLNLNSHFPVYYEYRNIRDALYVDVTFPSHILDSNPKYESGMIDWCNSCQRWVRVVADEQKNFKLSKCTECDIPFNYNVSAPNVDVERIRLFDRILSSPDKYNGQQKRDMPLHLIALGRWRRLSPLKQILVSKYLDSCGGHLGKALSSVLVYTDVILSNPGDLIELSKLRSQYQKLSDSLLKHVNDTLWQQWITGQVSSLCGRNILRKRDAKVSGEYIRLPISDLEEI